MRGSERGSATVEFALVMPILMVFLLAMIQAGLMLRDQLLVVDAARAGAREASISAADDEVRSAAVVAAADLDPSRLETIVTRSSAQGEPVSVSVRYSMPTTVPFIGWLFPSSVTLSGSATFRQEFVPP